MVDEEQSGRCCPVTNITTRMMCRRANANHYVRASVWSSDVTVP